jgi:hypothetical protein
MQKNYFIKHPHTANRLFWKGKLKPGINTSVGGLYNTTNVYIPVPKQDSNYTEGYSFIKKQISSSSQASPAISSAFLHAHCGQKGSGESFEEEPIVQDAFEHPIKVN